MKYCRHLLYVGGRVTVTAVLAQRIGGRRAQRVVYASGGAMKGGIKIPNIAEDVFERTAFSMASLPLNDVVPQSTEIVLQFGEGIVNVEF